MIIHRAASGVAPTGNEVCGPGVVASGSSAFWRLRRTLLAKHEGMLTMHTAPAMTLVFLGVVVSLGAAFVWAFWEIEQVSKTQRHGDHFH